MVHHAHQQRNGESCQWLIPCSQGRFLPSSRRDRNRDYRFAGKPVRQGAEFLIDPFQAGTLLTARASSWVVGASKGTQGEGSLVIASSCQYGTCVSPTLKDKCWLIRCEFFQLLIDPFSCRRRLQVLPGNKKRQTVDSVLLCFGLWVEPTYCASPIVR